MPDQFIKFPRVESIQYFESAMYGHNKVLRCKKISDAVITSASLIFYACFPLVFFLLIVGAPSFLLGSSST